MTTGPAFAFQHILIRDAAYSGLLKRSAQRCTSGS